MKGNPNSLDDTYTCTDCDRIFIGVFQYNLHMKSHKHKRTAASKKKRKDIETQLILQQNINKTWAFILFTLKLELERTFSNKSCRYI